MARALLRLPPLDSRRWPSAPALGPGFASVGASSLGSHTRTAGAKKARSGGSFWTVVGTIASVSIEALRSFGQSGQSGQREVIGVSGV